MAGFNTVAQDLDNLNAQVKAATGKTYPVAITEFAFLGSFSQLFYTTSFMSAIYAADIVRFFAGRSDILLANFWSLSGDDVFGSFWNWLPNPRPVYFVLLELSIMVNSFTSAPQNIPLNLNSAYTVSTPNIGYTSAATYLPFSGLALNSATDNHAYVFLINKDLNNSATVTLQLSSLVAKSKGYSGYNVTMKEFYTANPFVKWTYYDNPGPAASLNWTAPVVTQSANMLDLVITLKPHSIQSLKFSFTGGQGFLGASTSTTGGVQSDVADGMRSG